MGRVLARCIGAVIVLGHGTSRSVVLHYPLVVEKGHFSNQASEQPLGYSVDVLYLCRIILVHCLYKLVDRIDLLSASLQIKAKLCFPRSFI